MTLLLLLRPRRGYYVSGSVAATVAQFQRRAFVYKPQKIAKQSQALLKQPARAIKKIRKAKAKIAEVQALPKVKEADSQELESTLNALRELERLLSEAKAIQDEAARRAQEAEVAAWLRNLLDYVTRLRHEILLELEEEDFLLLALATL